MSSQPNNSSSSENMTESNKKKPYVPEILDKKMMNDYDPVVVDKARKYLCENLRAVLAEWQISRTTISKICGVSKPTVTQWFSGKYFPRLGNLMLLAKYINRNPQSFFLPDGIHLDKDDGGFNAAMHYKSSSGDVSPDAPLVLRDLFDNIAKGLGIELEPEALDDSVINGIGRLNRTEQILVANWRLLSAPSQSYILHAIYLEGKYSRDMIKKNNSTNLKIEKSNEESPN